MVIRDEFEKRLDEIDLYFEILSTIELDKPKLISFDVLQDKQQEIIFDSKRINIFRASAFLLLYNLVESTVFNSVVTIFDSISSDHHAPKLKYFDVIDEIKVYWLNNLYKHDEETGQITVVKKFKEITDKISNETLALTSNYIQYGGSLDARKIAETAKSLGINTASLNRGYLKNTHGEALKEIKKKRNWLAHGEKTFAEIGQDYPYPRLLEWKQYTVEHLEKFIFSVEEYIRLEEYKCRASG